MTTTYCHMCGAPATARIEVPSADGHRLLACASCVGEEAEERGGALVWVAIGFVFYLAAALSYVAFVQVANAAG